MSQRMFKPTLNLGKVSQVQQLIDKLEDYPDADDWDISQLIMIEKRIYGLRVKDFETADALDRLAEIIQATLPEYYE